MKKTLSILSTASVGILMLPLTAVAEGTSPWLPAPGQLALGIGHTQQTADTTYIGEQKLSVSAITGGLADEYVVDTTSIQLSYGISDSLSLDAALSYAEVDAGATDSDTGLADSVIGIQWRVADEYLNPNLPSVALRAAAIISGDYESDRFAAIGKAANGVELAVIAGKQLSPIFSVWGEVGYQNRDSSVPDATYFNVNAGVSFTSTLSGSVGFSRKKYSGDLDIDDPEFTGEFAETREERYIIKVGLNYAFAENQGLSFNLGKATAGRNGVKDDRIVSVAYSYGFN